MPRKGKTRKWRCSVCEASSRAKKCPAANCYYVVCCNKCSLRHLAYNHALLYTQMGRPALQACQCRPNFGYAGDNAKTRLLKIGKKSDGQIAPELGDALAELRHLLIQGIPAGIGIGGVGDQENAPD